MWPFRRKATAPPISIDPFLGDPEARRLSDALAKHDWTACREILNTRDSDRLSFYMEIAADAPGVQDWIEGPIRDEPQSTLPLLVRGAHAVFWAWEARGTGLSDSVSREQWNVWFKRLKLAEDCLDEVIERDPTCVEAWHYLVILGRARQLPIEERWRRFNALVEIDPHHLYGHEQMLSNLMAKWSGSSELMFDFAHSRSAGAAGTSIPVLIALAHLEHRIRNGGSDYMERPEVGEELVAAAQQSIWHPAYRRSIVTPTVWNAFALAFALADRFGEANRLFDEIGDDLVSERPWNSVDHFLRLREYVRARR